MSALSDFRQSIVDMMVLCQTIVFMYERNNAGLLRLSSRVQEMDLYNHVIDFIVLQVMVLQVPPSST